MRLASYTIWFLSLVFIAQPPYAEGKKTEAPMPDAALLALIDHDTTVEAQRGKEMIAYTTSDEVKLYAKHLEKEDRKADRYVRSLAGRLGIKLPKPARPLPVDVASIVSAQLFVRESMQSHAALMNTLEHQRRILPKDSPVYDLLGYLLPSIRRHYEAASSLEIHLAQTAGNTPLASIAFVSPNP